MERMHARPAPAFTPRFCAVQQLYTLLHILIGSKVVAVKPVDRNLHTPTVRHMMFLFRRNRNKGWASRSAAPDAKL